MLPTTHAASRRAPWGGRRPAALVAALCALASIGTAVIPAQADELPPTAAQRATFPRADDAVRPVPPPPPPAVSRTRMSCEACAIAGGIVLGAGAVHAAVGGIELSDPEPGEENRGRVLLVLGGVHAVVGLPLLVFGLWPEESTGARAAAPVEAGDVGVAVGPTGGSLRVAF